MLPLAVVAGLLVAGWVVYAFNGLVSLRKRAEGAWSDIDVQLKRRHDLVGNLVEAVKGYTHHEREVLEKVVGARTRAESARAGGSPGSAGRAEASLTGEMQRLVALVEAYPDLKASERFRDLQLALTEVEDDLQNARRYYNAVVRDLNTRVETFPNLLVARAFGFAEREYFSLDRPEEALPPELELTG